MIDGTSSDYWKLDASLAMATKRTIVVIGWLLLAVAFACVFAVAVIATFQRSGGLGVDYQRSGRPAFFMPVLYVPLLVAGVCVAGYWIWRKVHAGSDKEASNSTPHSDARTSFAMHMRLFSPSILLLIIWGTAAVGQGQEKAVFRPLPATTVEHMDKQRAYVSSLVQKHFPGTRITRTKADLETIQHIVDSALIPVDKKWEWQAVGIVFGDALADAIPGLRWHEVTDAYGTDPTLRYESTSLQVNAMTMISKRIEDGKKVDVADIAAWLADFIKHKAHEYR